VDDRNHVRSHLDLHVDGQERAAVHTNFDCSPLCPPKCLPVYLIETGEFQQPGSAVIQFEEELCRLANAARPAAVFLNSSKMHYA